MGLHRGGATPPEPDVAGGYRFHRGYIRKGQILMPRYSKFYSQAKVGAKMANGKIYIDYKNVEEIRRLLSANGKMSSRQRTKLSAMMQRHASTAVKRARYMALLPYEGDNR